MTAAASSAWATPCNPYTDFARQRSGHSSNWRRRASAKCDLKCSGCEAISAPTPSSWTGSMPVLPRSCRSPTTGIEAPSASMPVRLPSRGRGSRSKASPVQGSRTVVPSRRPSPIILAMERHPEWRIAVLVRAKNHAREIAASLRMLRIPFRAVDIEPLQDRGMVRDIMMLTRALLHLGDRIAWLAVLRAPWAGLSLADLLLIGRARPLVWEAMRDDEFLLSLSEDGRARCGRVRTILQAAFAVRNDSSIARWVERAWLGLGGPSCASSAQELDLAGAAFSRLKMLEERG